MWIKNQSGDMTIQVCGYSWSWEWDEYEIHVHPINDGQSVIKMGSYSTENKVRKVIQMLDEHLQKRRVKQRSDFDPVVWEILTILPNREIFQMPQDDEVE